MAKQQQILYLEDSDFLGFNLSFHVGLHGANQRGDVMLIQALFNFISDITSTGLKSTVDLPFLTGRMDGATQNAIMAFQFRWTRLLLPEFMGMIFPLPPKYRLAKLEDRRPAMAMLNELAWTSKGGASETLPHALLKEFPELRPLLRVK